jgi:hypothetical protein
MGELLRVLGRLAGLVILSSVALLGAVLGAVLAPAAAADDGAVVQGPWTITAKYVSGDKDIQFADDTWKMSFGEGCAAGSACDAEGGAGIDDSTSMALRAAGDGFRYTAHLDLDCFDTVTGELSTTHGADYEMTATLTASKVEEVDGTRYVTAMTGTLVENIVVNAAGRADNCTAPGGTFEEHKRSTLTGTADQLPAPPAGTSSQPAGVGPASADTSGTIPGFTLPLDDEAARSVTAVDDGRRSSVPGALTVPSESVATITDRLPQDLLLVAILGLLMVFPAQIFNSTYEENHERISRFAGRFRRRRRAEEGSAPAAPGRFRRVAVFVVSAGLGTVLGGLLDPEFGANRATAALLIGVFVALLAAVAVATVAAWVFRTARHRPHHWYLRAIPSGLVVAVACVLVSRLTDFAPGYLYGLLGGAVFAGVLEKRTEGRAESVTLLAGLLVALGAWVAFEPVAHAANAANPNLGVLVADSLLGCLFIGGIEGMLFSLVPLRFLPGHRLKQWGWVPWALLTALTLYVFVHVLLVPSAGYLGRSTSASTNVTVALFIAFGVLSMGFWAWFRFRPEKSGIPGPSAGPPDDAVVPVGLHGPLALRSERSEPRRAVAS